MRFKSNTSRNKEKNEVNIDLIFFQVEIIVEVLIVEFLDTLEQYCAPVACQSNGLEQRTQKCPLLFQTNKFPSLDSKGKLMYWRVKAK